MTLLFILIIFYLLLTHNIISIMMSDIIIPATMYTTMSSDFPMSKLESWWVICFLSELKFVAISSLWALLSSGTPRQHSAFLSKVRFETSGDFKTVSRTLRRYPWSVICFPSELRLVAYFCLSMLPSNVAPGQYFTGGTQFISILWSLHEKLLLQLFYNSILQISLFLQQCLQISLFLLRHQVIVWCLSSQIHSLSA